MPQEITSPKPFVFVLMPFDKSFKDVYELGIKPAALECGTYAERLDDQTFDEDMVQRIHNQINKADFIIADMSGSNPNVFYEVGYAHALNKQVIHICREGEKLPFDISHRPHVLFASVTELKEKITKKLRYLVGQLGARRSDYSTLEVIVAMDGEDGLQLHSKLATVDDVGPSPQGKAFLQDERLVVTFRNAGKSLSPELPYVALLTPVSLAVYVRKFPDRLTTEYPRENGAFISIAHQQYRETPLGETVPVLLPNAAHTISISIGTDDEKSTPSNLPPILRLVGPEGTQDYPIVLR